MNKIKFLSLISAAAILPALVSCSDNDDSEIRNLAARASITLSGYYGPDGKVVLPKWNAGDNGIIMLNAGGQQRTATAAPIVPGSTSSEFLFNILANREETDVVSWYPSAAELSFSDGAVSYNIPVSQDGTENPVLFGVDRADVNAYAGCKFNLTAGACRVMVTVAMGDYDITSIELKSVKGEKIAGDVTYNIVDGSYSATSDVITITPKSPVNCRTASAVIPALCAPVTLSGGLKATITTAAGEKIVTRIDDEIVLDAAGKYETGKMAESESTELVFCGDNHVFVINASIVKDSYTESIVWSLDAKTLSASIGLDASRCDHLDDCKFIDNGHKLMLSSSYGWAAVLEYPSAKVLFSTTQSGNAHSIEYIPGDFIAVACSGATEGNYGQVQIYDMNRSNTILAHDGFASAHGLVWDYKRNVLYAIAGQSLRTYEISGLDSRKPELKLAKTVSTPYSGLHDLTRVDDDNLCVAGNHAYLYNIVTGKFDEMKRFSSSTALKSVNYNSETGEVWYTDSTIPEGNETWSSHKIRYVSDRNSSGDDRIINVNDIDMYKVRVKQW